MKLEPRIEATRIDNDTVDIKQYIGDELLTTSRFFADATQKVLATQFHPTCEDCMGVAPYTFESGKAVLKCYNPFSKCFDKVVNGTTDYCNKWEAI